MASSCEYSTSGYIDISPFKKNWMDLILYGKSYFEENLMTNNTKKQLSGNNYAAVVSFLYKNWSFRYAIQTKAFHLSGDFRKFDQNTAIISLNYGTSTLSIGGELYFAFQNGSRYGYSVDSKIFKSDYSSEIFDNGNMFVLNISYNFSHGHVPSIFQRKIQNNDQDSGILKPD